MIFPKEYEKSSPLAFMYNNKIKTENGSNIEFHDHKFLVEPYADMNPRQAIIKCSQVGWSVLAINKSLWLANFKKANIIYTMPSASIVKDFVTPKVDPIIQANPVYGAWMGKTNSVALKNVGDRFIYFRGSWEQSAAISISAHVLINDELDRSNQQVVRTYRSRLDDALRERPDLGYIWQFSNPSIPGFGVHEAFDKSDQKHWFIKCPYCGNEHYMRWPESVNLKNKTYVCIKCHEELPDSARRDGRWVKKYKDRTISGYWISQLFVPWIPASKVIEDSEGDKSVFYNFTLGLPYLSKDQGVSRKMITDCISPDFNPKTNVAIGVDNGVRKTVVIGNVDGIFRTYETDAWEDIEEDIRRYNATCVIDALPYPATPIRLSEEYRGRVFINYFNTGISKSGNVIEWGKGDKRNVVKSDRTKIIDMVVGELQNKEILFNMTTTQLEQYIFDWTQIYKQIETNSQGISRATWKTIEGRRDHFAFASIYWRIALEKTFVASGVVRTPTKRSKMRESIYISPDSTVPAIDIKDVLNRAKGKKDWRTK